MSADRRHIVTRVWMISILIGIYGLLLVGSVLAGYSATSTYDPTPGSPGSGDECTITFSSPGNSAQNQTDVNATKKAFDDAMAGSDDMKDKVKDACAKNGNSLNINVARDDSDLTVGNTNTNGNINVDVGDIEDMGATLSGKAKDKEKIVKNFLTRVIAHEIDHNREAPGDSHGDPADPKPGETGPAVDDANKVAKDLGTGVQRNEYAYKVDGKWRIDFTVDGQKVTWDLAAYLAARKAASKFAPATEHILVPPATEDLPDKPCGVSPCYGLALATDSDLDGIDDLDGGGLALDNCVFLANPWQVDVDGDGEGHGCDLDDDADGCLAALENVMGCSDLCVTCTPEHWSCSLAPLACVSGPNPCMDGIDNDGDGWVDADDRGCMVPEPDPVYFPRSLEPWQVYPEPQRFDLGGIPEDGDSLMVRGMLDLDYDMDGWADDSVLVSGLVAVRRQEPILHPNGTPEWIDMEIVAMSLHGVGALGPLVIQESTDQGSFGYLVALFPESGSSFPATGALEPWFEMDYGLPLHGMTATTLIPAPDVSWWPLYETGWTSTAPTPLLDEYGAFVMVVVFMQLEFVRDGDFDDVMDPEDNCPATHNPAQGNGDFDPWGDACDCDAGDPFVWSTPEEVPDLQVGHDPFTGMTFINAGIPAPGAQIEHFDVIRAPQADGFTGPGAICLATDRGAIIDVLDPDPLGSGEISYYLARAENGCPGPAGTGPLGNRSDGTPRDAIPCSGIANTHHVLFGQPLPVSSIAPFPDADGDGFRDATYGCLNCHDQNFTVERNCAVCH